MSYKLAKKGRYKRKFAERTAKALLKTLYLEC